MSIRRFSLSDKTIYLIIAAVVIIVAFLLLGGLPWMKGMMHGNRSAGIADWNWVQIIISMFIGFLLGWLFSRKR